MNSQSIAAIQRALLTLEREGGEALFGEPALELNDLMRTDLSGRGIISILYGRPTHSEASIVFNVSSVAFIGAVRKPS